MAYTDQQMQDWYFGTGGSESDIRQGAFVTMSCSDVYALLYPWMSTYDSAFAGKYRQAQATGYRGFSEWPPFKPTAGNNTFSGSGQIWNGPIKSYTTQTHSTINTLSRRQLSRMTRWLAPFSLNLEPTPRVELGT
jgi:hypothetical protein